MSTSLLVGLGFSMAFGVSVASASDQSHCWVNEPARMECLKQHSIKDGSFAKTADPKNARVRFKDGSYNLHYLAGTNSPVEAEALILAGAPVNAFSTIHGTPLNVAARFTQAAMVELLLSHGADPNGRDSGGNTPILNALEVGHPRASGEGLDEVGQKQIVDALLARGIDLNVVNQYAQSPLGTVIFERDLRRKFIAAGADPNLRLSAWKVPGEKPYKKILTDLSDPPLIVASRTDGFSGRTSENSAEAISDLLAAGAKVDSRDASGNTALMQVAGFNNLEGLNILLKARARTNAKNNFGQNALMIAILRSSDPSIVEVLKSQTNLQARDIYGRTVADYLAKKFRPEEKSHNYRLTSSGFPWQAR